MSRHSQTSQTHWLEIKTTGLSEGTVLTTMSPVSGLYFAVSLHWHVPGSHDRQASRSHQVSFPFCSQAGRLTIAAAGRCNATLLAAGRFRGMLLHCVNLSVCLHTFPCTSATLQPVCIRYVAMCVSMHPSTCPNLCRAMQPSIYETFTSSINVCVDVSVSMYP